MDGGWVFYLYFCVGVGWVFVSGVELCGVLFFVDWVVGGCCGSCGVLVCVMYGVCVWCGGSCVDGGYVVVDWCVL